MLKLFLAKDSIAHRTVNWRRCPEPFFFIQAVHWNISCCRRIIAIICNFVWTHRSHLPSIQSSETTAAVFYRNFWMNKWSFATVRIRWREISPFWLARCSGETETRKTVLCFGCCRQRHFILYLGNLIFKLRITNYSNKWEFRNFFRIKWKIKRNLSRYMNMMNYPSIRQVKNLKIPFHVYTKLCVFRIRIFNERKSNWAKWQLGSR